ncbi:MAG: ABC transporter substrate-binding protein [Bacteroidota bacterium]
MKKSVYLLLVLALVISVSFSVVCAAGKIEVKVLTWWLSAFNDYLVQMEQEFEKKNPNIDIVLDNFDGDIMQTLTTRIASGDIPDLVNLNNETALTYYQKGALEPLDLYLSKEDINVYVDSLWNKTKFDGKFGYTFPWYASPQVLFINDEIFAKAGLDPVKDAPKTWEDMEKIGKVIKDKTGFPAFAIEFANLGWEETLRVGSDVFTKDLKKVAFNNKKVADRLEYLRRCYAAGLMPKNLPDYQAVRSMFEQSQIAMFPLGLSMYRWIKADNPKLKFTVAPYPVSPNGADRLHVSMMNFVVMKASKVKKEAVKVGQFLTSSYAQIKFAVGPASIIPSTKVSVDSDPEFAKGADQGKVKAQIIAAKTMKAGDNLIVTIAPKGVDTNQLFTAVRDEFLKAIRGDKTVKDALKAAETQANQMIKASQ